MPYEVTYYGCMQPQPSWVPHVYGLTMMRPAKPAGRSQLRSAGLRLQISILIDAMTSSIHNVTQVPGSSGEFWQYSGRLAMRVLVVVYVHCMHDMGYVGEQTRQFTVMVLSRRCHHR